MIAQLKLTAIIAAASVAVGAAGGWKVASWHYQAREARAVKAAAAADRANLLDIIEIQKGQIRAATEVSDGYQAELTRLGNGGVLTPVVRVRDCPRIPSSGPSATGATPSGPDAAGQAGGLVPPADARDSGLSRDIGPDLMALVAEADKCSAQLRALQSWVKRTSVLP